ncbi:MAG: tRNA (N(6)-L-threonylcarbamoyladenosine(37)-C(2))-methylthiotransferase MtaB [Proteobacteria bacterium]|nr:tRNA (N(6)-L-threonylcarbamoyladenosine(37)-C(2))-methylthiotransferase MtaB [Pseudomonadota bacterium]MDA1355485.1 tRNA (N(6)-L-threonylcarbamoyladenosine(37)-C(2))-methylthiotransferase MtaB [Pseudomonadota bacterium]
MSAPEIVTFGCRLNAFESEIMRDHAAAAGLERTVIFNTCAVTAEAERQARQAIRRARRADPEARIIVTGCAAQIDPARYAAMPEVDRVIGNAEKLEAASFLPSNTTPIQVNDIMSVRATAPHLIAGFEGRARAFVQVQNGCDHRCTFCIIPYGRGNNRGVALGEIVAQARALVESGTRELVLTGVDLSSYGRDLPGTPSLGQAVRRLLAAVPELQRLRLSSLDPAVIDDDLKRLIAEEPRLMPHIHLSVQAGDDMILKRMKRRHNRADILRLAAELRALRPDIALGADLIAGFPTENDEMFANSLSIVAEAGLTWLHVFPYSPRAGTPAARMPQLPRGLIRERAARLRQAGDTAVIKFLDAQVDRVQDILVEKADSGRSAHYAPVRLVGGLAGGQAGGLPGDVLAARALRRDGPVLIVEAAA